MSSFDYPFWEAVCNGCALILMCTAMFAIKTGRRELHIRLMKGAVGFSAAFLGLYLIYHFTHTSVPYEGNFRTLYYVILITHIILAALVPFLVGYVLYQAWRQNFVKHKRIARITFPIWAYVSATGIIIYLMVHR